MPSLRILLTGASGPIGAALRSSFQSRDYEVVRLVRGSPSSQDQVKWDPHAPLPPESVSNFDTVIHLAGDSIVGRWTAAKKARILESRATGTRNLAEALAKAAQRPRVFISASAIGYYGNRGDEVLREDSASGNDFLSEVCRQWEAATEPAGQAGIRTVNLRIGLMLSAAGGALQKMLLPFCMGAGGRIGDGRQWWSWIAIDDLVGAVHHAMKADLLHGPVNAVAPRPVTNAEFTRILALVLHRPAVFPMPAFAARLAFGQMADELLLASQRVEPAKLVASGYPFQHSELAKALEGVLKK
jgi:uncharacterized protein